jgi:CHAT domain-containing protein
LNQLTSTRYLAMGLKEKEKEKISTSIALFGGVDYETFEIKKNDTTNTFDQSSYILNIALASSGNGSFRSGLEYLPGTKKEVEDIGVILKQNKWDVNIATEKNASENTIKLFSEKNSKSIMHIATHGFAIPERIENKKNTTFEVDRGYEKYTASDNAMIRSGLLLSGANWTWQGKGDTLLKMTNEDGVLTAYELSQLDLSNTKLVVLSACQTGKGAIQGSEGTFGLKRALKLAGVDNMIVSLWDVPDNETMEMMTLFYTELAKTKLPVSAFELAQKAMRNKYPNEPVNWAGFVFVR